MCGGLKKLHPQHRPIRPTHPLQLRRTDEHTQQPSWSKPRSLRKEGVRRSDKARASYYRHISGKRWGDARHYELTVDSSVGLEKAAELIVQYVSVL